MASSSSSRTWRYRVYMSFRVPDVRKTFLSHLRAQFSRNGITMAPVPTQGVEESIILIRESRISIIVLSKNFASSAWCLGELLEILKCKEEMGHIVMPIFYGVDPYDVQKPTGYFGRTFEQFCAGITEEKEEKRRVWSQGLAKVGIIAGVESRYWDNEAKMIEKIAQDVLDKLNATPSKDFDDMVGLEAHLREMESLLDLDSDGVEMVGIYGPSGIGKSTIARVLHSKFSSRFQLTCFVENLRENYHSGFDEYGLKLRLQEQFLSKVLNHNGIRISHLGAVKENLFDQKVLIILDDVSALNQLEALANETTWFGPGSRIVVTTKNQELLHQHGINNAYDVRSPSTKEALKILCKYAFRQEHPHDGFKELAKSVGDLCGNLPLGLREVGSSLRGKKKGEWEKLKRRFETVDSRDIEQVRRAINELAPSNRPAGKSKSMYSTGMAFLVVINLLLEIASAVADQLSSIHKHYFARLSLLLSFLSVVLSILDIRYKIRAHKARFRCKWPIPWFYYNGEDKIFGSFTDTVILFCAVGQLIVSTINYSFTERSREGPIKVSVWPLFFAIGMVISKFMENPDNAVHILPITKKDQ